MIEGARGCASIPYRPVQRNWISLRMVLPSLEKDACVLLDRPSASSFSTASFSVKAIARPHHLVEGLLSWPARET